MDTPVTNSLDLLRGALVLIAFAALSIGVLYLFDYGGPWRTPHLPMRQPGVMAALERRSGPEPAGLEHEKQAKVQAVPPAPATAATAAPARAPANAAEALRQALSAYQNDPKHTATISVSSSGRISYDGKGDLTVYDGLPARSVQNGALLSGGSSQTR